MLAHDLLSLRLQAKRGRLRPASTLLPPDPSVSTQPQPSGAPHPRSNALFSAALLLSASTLASRILGQLRDLILVWKLGASADTDAYLAAFWLPDLLSYFLAGGAFTISFVPAFAKAVSEGRSSDGWRLFSNIATLTAAVLLAAISLCWWFAPEIVACMYPAFSASQQATTVSLTRIILPGPIFFFIGGLLTATETVRGSFVAASLTPLVYNLCIIAGGLLLAPWVGVAGFSWGVLAGAVSGALLIPLALAWPRLRYRPAIHLRDPELQRYLVATLPLLVGVSLLTVDEWMIRYFGATLGVGAITHLSNARKLMLVPASLIGQSVSYAILPSLSNDLAAGRADLANERMSRSIATIVALSTIASAALVTAAIPAVSAIYMHGAFGASDAAATSAYLRILALTVPGWCLATVASRGFYARQENGRAMLVTSAITLVSVPVYAFGAGQGGDGLAWASVVGCTLQGVVIATMLDLRHGTRTVAMAARGALQGLLFGVPAALLLSAWRELPLARALLPGRWGSVGELVLGALLFASATAAYVRRSEPALFERATGRISKRLRRVA